MLKNADSQSTVLWPSIKLPFRKYPVYVYVYAVALYLTSQMSMRETAIKVSQKFGLQSFSHSTISRTLKKLSIKVDDLLIILNSNLSPPDSSPALINRNHWTLDKILKYKNLVLLIYPVLIKENEIIFSSELNYNCFIKTKNFLI